MSQSFAHRLVLFGMAGIFLLTAIGCAEKKVDQPAPAVAEKTKTSADAVGPNGSGSVWLTPQQASSPLQTITYTYPTNVPPILRKIDLSKYQVQFLPLYPATIASGSTGDTLRAQTPVLIMNVVRFDTTGVPINNFVGCGIADQKVVLITGMFTPAIPPHVRK